MPQVRSDPSEPVPEPSEPMRLQLGDSPEEADQGSRSAGALSPVTRRPSSIPHCRRCGGELTRSRVRRYERLVTMFMNKRPYRCIDCKVRRWR
jgi:hypothetical protein